MRLSCVVTTNILSNSKTISIDIEVQTTPAKDRLCFVEVHLNFSKLMKIAAPQAVENQSSRVIPASRSNLASKSTLISPLW